MADVEASKQVEEKPVDDSDISTNWDECTTTFDSMDLKEDLLRGIYAYGFEKPSAIQQVRLTCFGSVVIFRFIFAHLDSK